MNENTNDCMDLKISPHFKRSEFACRCGCGLANPYPELLVVLEDVREHFDSPIEISGPCRCAVRNSKTKGASNKSRHMPDAFGFCQAADIKVWGVSADDVADYLEAKYPDKYGIGRYKGRTHIDVRANKARWDKRNVD